MLSRSLLLARLVGKRAIAPQSVRHSSESMRDIAVKYNNDIGAIPIPQGSWKADFKANDFKYNWQMAVLLVLNIACYGYVAKTYPGTDENAVPKTMKIDPPVFNKYPKSE